MCPITELTCIYVYKCVRFVHCEFTLILYVFYSLLLDNIHVLGVTAITESTLIAHIEMFA